MLYTQMIAVLKPTQSTEHGVSCILKPGVTEMTASV
jgi:hypothetical protein